MLLRNIPPPKARNLAKGHPHHRHQKLLGATDSLKHNAMLKRRYELEDKNRTCACEGRQGDKRYVTEVADKGIILMNKKEG